MFRTVPRFLLILFALSPIAHAQLGNPKTGGWHEDPIHGFKVRMPADWSKTPPQEGESYTIATLNGDDAVDLKNPGYPLAYPTTLEILKFEPEPPEQPVTPSGGDDNDPEARKRRIEEAIRRAQGFGAQAHDFLQYCTLRRFTGLDWEDKKHEPKKVRGLVRTEYKGKRDSNGGRAKYAVYAVTFDLKEQYGYDICLCYQVADLDQKDTRQYMKFFESLAKTFQTIDRIKIEAEENAEGVVTDRAKRRAELEARHKSMPEWRIQETENYLVVINSDDAGFVREILQRIELIRKQLEKDFPPINPITAVSVLRVCKNREDYMNYGGMGGSAGYWSAYHRELVIYDDKEVRREQSFWTLNHEAFHQYIFYRCGEIAPHSWYNEGTGDYYAGFQYKRNGFKKSKFAWRLPIVKRVLGEGIQGPVLAKHRLANLIKYSQAEYYSDAGNCYALGWSLVWFLKEGRGSRGWQKEWETILPTYLDVITQTKDQDQALAKAFEGVDLDALETAWIGYAW